MIKTFPQIRAIAVKDIRDAIRTHIIVAVAGFLLLAALAALAVSGIAMQVEAAATAYAGSFFLLGCIPPCI